MPLPQLPKRRPTRLLLALFLAAAIVAITRNGTEVSPATAIAPDAEAVLVVDGIDYPFELDTCFVGNDSFVVAGHGRQNDEDFRVLASSSEVELAFGVTDEADPVPEDSLWLGTEDSVSWSATEAGVTAWLELAERLGDDQVVHAAQLRINCGVAS
jgi:hypothetical protein